MSAREWVEIGCGVDHWSVRLNGREDEWAGVVRGIGGEWVT